MPLKKIQPQKSEFDHKNKHPENPTKFLKFYLRRHCLLVGGSEFICNGCLVKFRFSKREPQGKHVEKVQLSSIWATFIGDLKTRRFGSAQKMVACPKQIQV